MLFSPVCCAGSQQHFATRMGTFRACSGLEHARSLHPCRRWHDPLLCRPDRPAFVAGRAALGPPAAWSRPSAYLRPMGKCSRRCDSTRRCGPPPPPPLVCRRQLSTSPCLCCCSWVASSVAATTALIQWQAIRVAIARKECGINYPQASLLGAQRPLPLLAHALLGSRARQQRGRAQCGHRKNNVAFHAMWRHPVRLKGRPSRTGTPSHFPVLQPRRAAAAPWCCRCTRMARARRRSGSTASSGHTRTRWSMRR